MGILKRYDIMEDINPLKHMLEAWERNAYVRIGSDMSVTEIINSPRIVQLQNRYPDKMKPDTIDGALPAILGTSTHDMFERYLRTYDIAHPGTYLLERRMLTVVECPSGRRVRVAGRFDILERQKILWDIKQTSTFKFVKGMVDDYEKQLNIYAHMLRLDGVDIQELKILAVFPDWNKWERQRQGGSYPPNKITAYKFTMWDPDTAKEFFENRVELHDDAAQVKTENLPLCSDEEMWAAPTKWAVYRDKSVRKASRLLDTKREALDYIKDSDYLTSTAYIVERPGVRTRCSNFCRAANICTQYQDYLASQ